MASGIPTASGGEAPRAPDVARRRQAALAGHLGDVGGARAALGDAAPSVRATALGALARAGGLDDDTLRWALADPSPTVRSRAAELASGRVALRGALIGCLDDDQAEVAESAAFALGEAGNEVAHTAAVAALAGVARRHPDALCREAAVAALGAIGDTAGLAAILDATTDRPAVRRRAVLALAPFDGPLVDAALTRALEDRDWQVRQAAEDLTGGSST